MGIYNYVKQKELHHWVGGYVRYLGEKRKAEAVSGPRHVMVAFCDHWEPRWGDASDEKGDARVETWGVDYPKLAGQYRDADGVHPQHSFFFPGEQYRPRWIDTLAELSKKRLGEVELHLHHDGDTEETLRRDILKYIGDLANHGHLSRDPDGRLRYAFIHGNWCLANSNEDGRYCGVDNEIPLLFDTGCYADFTFPASESSAQPNIVNQIYWPTGDIAQRRAHEHGERAKVGEVKRDRLLMIEGPSAISLRAKKMPLKIETGNVSATDTITPARVKKWVETGVHVEGRPEWVFVKVHTHGAPERQATSILGESSKALHETLRDHFNDGEKYVLHYTTAREMFNIAIAAMEGKTGSPNEFRDHLLKPPPVRA